MNRPYQTSELLALLHERLGIQPHHGYISQVIRNPKDTNNPHPLAAAYLARGMWDKELVDAYLSSPDALNVTPRGKRSKKHADNHK